MQHDPIMEMAKVISVVFRGIFAEMTWQGYTILGMLALCVVLYCISEALDYQFEIDQRTAQGKKEKSNGRH